MSNDELALMVQGGDRDQLPALWGQVERLCYKIVNRYYSFTAENIAVSLEDLRQESYFAMVEAVRLFKPEMGSFNTILNYCVRNRCMATLGLLGRVKHEHYLKQSLDKPLTLKAGETRTLADALPDDTLPGPTDAIELDELQRDVRAAVDKLPRVEGEIVRDHYLEGVPIREIAEARGVTVCRIQQRKIEALERLRSDQCMKAYAEINFHQHKGVNGFKSSGSSIVEDIVLRMESARERQQATIDRQIRQLREEMIAYAWGGPAASSITKPAEQGKGMAL